MSKLVLMSVVVMLLAAPLIASRDPHPVRGLKRALVSVLACIALYAFVLRVVVPRLG